MRILIVEDEPSVHHMIATIPATLVARRFVVGPEDTDRS
jgi:hypothetical protein